MSELLVLPEAAGTVLRESLGVGDGPLRITFCGGPGDVVGTYAHWRKGEADPRVPSVTYSAQMYDLAILLGAELQVISPFVPPPEVEHPFYFVQVARGSYRGRVGFHLRERRFIQGVTAAIEDFKPHVLVMSTDFPSAGWRSVGKGRMLVLTAHNTFWPMGQPPKSAKEKAKFQLLRRRSAALDGAVCTSEECARQIKAVTNGRVLGRAEHPQIKSTYEIQSRKAVRRLLFLGRIETNKGIFMLLEAFGTLKKTVPDLDLTFAGTGSQDARLRAAIEASGLPDVRFLGQLSGAEVHARIAASDLLVCPTTTGFREGLALVGFEAAAHGIPTVLSSVVPALDGLQSCAVPFRANDTEDLTRALRSVISDAVLYAKLCDGTSQVRQRLYDKELSWGSQLARVLTAL